MSTTFDDSARRPDPMNVEQRRQVDVIMTPHPWAWSELLAGIGEYGRTHGRWIFNLRGLRERGLRRQLRRSPAGGFIAQAARPDDLEPLLDLGRPVVGIDGQYNSAPPAGVGSDDEAVGRVGAEHLLESGLDRLAYLGTDLPFSLRREAGFAAAVGDSGRTLLTIRRSRPGGDFVEMRTEAGEQMLIDWLATAELPAGIMVCDDQHAKWAEEIVLQHGLLIPQQVAVLGTNNYEISCFFAPVPLSSVDRNLERTGWEAAALLDRLMAGEEPPAEPVLIEPRGVAQRDSTALVTGGDRIVEEALWIMRRSVSEPLRRGDLAKAVQTSPSTLDRHFRRRFGVPASEYLRKLRLGRIREMLTETDMPLDRIAAHVGLASRSHLHRECVRLLGMSPGAYRLHNRKVDK